MIRLIVELTLVLIFAGILGWMIKKCELEKDELKRLIVQSNRSLESSSRQIEILRNANSKLGLHELELIRDGGEKLEIIARLTGTINKIRELL